MKIWIDLTNSPHVNFFKGMIRELQREHDFLLTCRPLANTIELLELFEISHHVVGSHYGQNKVKKILGFIIRIIQLYIFLKNKNVDIGVSHSGFNVPIVSRLLGIPCLYLNDNEHADANRVSFLFANKIMVPEFIDIDKIKRMWAKECKIIMYPGIKEGVYLWPYKDLDSNKRDIQTSKNMIFIRPEPWTAQYYKSARNFIDGLLLDIKDKYKIILLPRGKEQEIYYHQDKFSGIIVPEKSISLNEIIKNCDLFIGAGGTMTRETAVLGIPTISIYQDELLGVDKYLISRGFMTHKRNITAKFVGNFLGDKNRRLPDRQLIIKGKEAYELIKKTLLNLTQ